MIEMQFNVIFGVIPHEIFNLMSFKFHNKSFKYSKLSVVYLEKFKNNIFETMHVPTMM